MKKERKKKNKKKRGSAWLHHTVGRVSNLVARGKIDTPSRLAALSTLSYSLFFILFLYYFSFSIYLSLSLYLSPSYPFTSLLIFDFYLYIPPRSFTTRPVVFASFLSSRYVSAYIYTIYTHLLERKRMKYTEG